MFVLTRPLTHLIDRSIGRNKFPLSLSHARTHTVNKYKLAENVNRILGGFRQQHEVEKYYPNRKVMTFLVKQENLANPRSLN